MDQVTLLPLDLVSSHSNSNFIGYTEDEILTTGSDLLLDLIMKHRKNITINVHGHCHPGRGMC